MPVNYRKGKGSCKIQPCTSSFGDECFIDNNPYKSMSTNSHVIQNNYNQKAEYYELGPIAACYKPWYNHTIGYIPLYVPPCKDTTNYCH